jgi:hypothetical protein
METGMGIIGGRYLDLPWGDDYEGWLSSRRDKTYEFSGDDLLHEIHKQAIEAHWINLKLYKSLRWRLNLVIAAQVAIAAYLLFRFGI